MPNFWLKINLGFNEGKICPQDMSSAQQIPPTPPYDPKFPDTIHEESKTDTTFCKMLAAMMPSGEENTSMPNNPLMNNGAKSVF